MEPIIEIDHETVDVDFKEELSNEIISTDGKSQGIMIDQTQIQDRKDVHVNPAFEKSILLVATNELSPSK